MEISEKKKAILESALVLITEKGFQGCPMSQVATKASVAAGTIYHYFESKDDLINEIYSYLTKGRMEAIFSRDDVNKKFEERFRNFWLNLYNYYIEHPKTIFFLEQYINSPYFKCQSIEYGDSFYSHLEKFMQQGVEEGAIKNIKLRLIVSLVNSSIVTTAKNHLLKIFEVTDDKLEQALNYSWDGIKAVKE